MQEMQNWNSLWSGRLLAPVVFVELILWVPVIEQNDSRSVDAGLCLCTTLDGPHRANSPKILTQCQKRSS